MVWKRKHCVFLCFLISRSNSCDWHMASLSVFRVASCVRLALVSVLWQAQKTLSVRCSTKTSLKRLPRDHYRVILKRLQHWKITLTPCTSRGDCCIPAPLNYNAIKFAIVLCRIGGTHHRRNSKYTEAPQAFADIGWLNLSLIAFHLSNHARI